MSSKQPERESLPGSPELKVLGVDTNEYRNGIPLAGWESIESALDTFASGASRGSRATEQHNIQAFSELNPLAGFLFLQANNWVSGSSFVRKMLEEAKTGIQDRGKWSRHYDYDGQGVFHKTTVEITGLKEPKETYVLGLNAAYVGKEVEDGLAAHLGIEQGLQRKSVDIQIAPDGDKVRVDFDKVLAKLQTVKLERKAVAYHPIVDYLKLTALTEGVSSLFKEKPESGENIHESFPITGKDVVDYFMKTDNHGSSPDPLVLGIKGEVELTLALGRVGERFTYDQGERSESRWNGEGSVLTTPLGTDYRNETVTPSLNITAQRVSKEKYNRLPLIDPQSKQVAEDLISAVAQAFRS